MSSLIPCCEQLHSEAHVVWCERLLRLSPCFVLCTAQVSWNECLLQGPTRAFALALLTGTLSHPRYLPCLCSQVLEPLWRASFPDNPWPYQFLRFPFLIDAFPPPLHIPRNLHHACNPEVTGGRLQRFNRKTAASLRPPWITQ